MNNTAKLLKVFEKDIEVNKENKNVESISSTRHEFLASFRKDAYYILICSGYKMKADELKNLERLRDKNSSNKDFNDIVNNLIEKYNNTLVYLILLGCKDHLNSFNEEYINNLMKDFESLYFDNSITCLQLAIQPKRRFKNI